MCQKYIITDKSTMRTKNRTHTHLPPPSEEQTAVIRSVVSDGCNVKLVSVAGSGKTTLSLHCVSRLRSIYPHKRVLLLTYNSSLKTETRKKVAQLDMGEDVIEVHSFHSFGKRYYSDDCRTDETLDDMVSSEPASSELLRRVDFDLLIVDESQDICPLYWEVILFIVRCNDASRGPLQFLFIGDPRQSIYEYKGADSRYLTQCDARLSLHTSRSWREHTLSTTWRLTPKNAAFVNDVLLGSHVLFASPSPPGGGGDIAPRFVMCNAFQGTPAGIIFDLLKRYRPDQIMVLAPSVKGQSSSGKSNNSSPLRILEKRLLDYRVPVNVNDVYEDCSLGEEVLRGKLVFMTFHGSKGMERDAVVVVGGTDEAYLKYFNKGHDPASGCPNPVYVCMTRARRELVIVHSSRSDLAPYVDPVRLPERADVEGEIRVPTAATVDSSTNTASTFTVTGLLSHLSYTKIREAAALLHFTKVSLSDPEPHPPKNELCATVRTRPGFAEYVADLNGIAIPAMLEYQDTGRTWLFDTLPTFDIGACATCSVLRSDLLSRGGASRGVGDFLCAATLYQSSRSQYFYRATQIRTFDWLEEADVEDAIACLRLSGIERSKNPQFEVPLQRQNVRGSADVITDNAVYEIKCTTTFQTVHLLQIALYAWILADDTKHIRLVYALSNEMYEVQNDIGAFERVAQMLLDSSS